VGSLFAALVGVKGQANRLGRWLGPDPRDLPPLDRRDNIHEPASSLPSDLPRKSLEPIALQAGTAVRTLQEFLVTARWDHLRERDLLQLHLAEAVAALPADPLGTVGIIDETSCT